MITQSKCKCNNKLIYKPKKEIERKTLNMNEMYIVAFNSTHHAIRTEKLLSENNIKVTTLPTPREIKFISKKILGETQETTYTLGNRPNEYILTLI